MVGGYVHEQVRACRGIGAAEAGAVRAGGGAGEGRGGVRAKVDDAIRLFSALFNVRLTNGIQNYTRSSHILLGNGGADFVVNCGYGEDT